MSMAIYRDYQKVFKATAVTGRGMPYEWSVLPSRLGIEWLAYAEMLEEFSRGLANVINALTDYERRLRAWAIVVGPLSDEEQMAAVHEFIGPLATTAVNLPYVIQARFAFAVAHLCHQANKAKMPDWTDNLPLDNEIHLSLAGHIAKPWRRRRRLLAALKAVAGIVWTGIVVG